MDPILCACCSTFFIPKNKTQFFCSSRICQRARKALWQKQKIETDPDYKQQQHLSQQKWLSKKSGYWKKYRSENPEKVARNRSLQRIRNMRNRGGAKDSGSSKSVLIAKMDARRCISYRLSGQYWLVPMVAKMDAVKIFIATVPVNSP